MKKQFLFGPVVLLVSLVMVTFSVRGEDIPNQFKFVSAQYFVSKGATGAVITVGFTPGNRGWSGSVNYATQDGTAVAGQDYTGVSGSLNFSGVNYRSFTVPLAAGEQQKTILLVLSASGSDPSAIISPGQATLTINLGPPPNVTVSPGANGTVSVSWTDDGTEPVLEKRISPTDPSWEVLGPVPSDGNGHRVYTDVSLGGMGFYRLRREQ